jgi:hypothetical protein
MTDLYGVPEYFAGGLMKASPLPGDIVRLILYRDAENGDREPVVSVLVPKCAVGAMIDAMICCVGPRYLQPAVDGDRRLQS